MSELRTDPEAVAAYRHALVDSGLMASAKVEAMDDLEVLDAVGQVVAALRRMAASVGPMVEAMRLAINDFGGKVAPLAEVSRMRRWLARRSGSGSRVPAGGWSSIRGRSGCCSGYAQGCDRR